MRILDWPRDLHWATREPLSGPRSIGSGSTESMSGYVQTYSSPFGLWRWSFSFAPMRGSEFRIYRGTMTALHGGANLIRVPFCDPDGLTFAQSGVAITQAQVRNGIPWSNSLPWSNGQNWRAGRPSVQVLASADAGATEIRLQDEHWGASLELGAMVGFAPFHFGLYIVTQVHERGRYRIWPPLRSAITTENFATLNPILAMRLEGEAGAPMPRGAASASGLAVTLVEVEDPDVRAYAT